ncbi:MAG: hypothetical protein ABGZ17_17595, partial [Planctomycetaceae bacterium]
NMARDIWTDGRCYAARVAELTGSGGLLQANVTVLDDASRDIIRGGKGRDLYFAKLGGSNKDKLKDKKPYESLFDLI